MRRERRSKKNEGAAGEEKIPVGRLRNLAVRIGGYDRREIGLMPLWLLYEEISDAFPAAKKDDDYDYEDVI